jgi:uncharacterized protein (DUF2147 family)
VNAKASWCALLFAFATQAQASGDIFGEWWTPGFNARVLIYACSEKACGRITWAWEETPPGIAERKSLVGQAIFDGLTPAPDEAWKGRIYNPEDGRSYASEVSLLTHVTLEVEGCVMLFCRRQVWRRFEPGSCPQVAPVEGANRPGK